jgi:NADPH2:quinone reductase
VVGLDWGGYLRREPQTVGASIAEALRWYAEGAIDPRPSHKFSLEHASEALKAQDARQISGKMMLITGET